MSSFSKNYRQIFAIVFVATGLFLSSIITFLIYLETTSENKKIEKNHVSYYLKTHENDINNFIKEHFDIIASFANNDFYYNYLYDHKYTYFQMFLRSIQSYNKNIKNITYTNANGDELIKLKRYQPGSSFILNHSNDLRNIKDTETFKNLKYLENGDIYVSKIKRNEFKNDNNDNDFELSIGYKIYDDFELMGVFILDLYLDDLLKSFTNTSSFKAYITDENKCVLQTNDTNLINSLSSSSNNECIKENINSVNSVTIYKSTTQKIDLHISSLKKDSDFFKELNKTYIIVFVLIIILSLFLSSYLADIPKKLNQRIKDQKKMFI